MFNEIHGCRLHRGGEGGCRSCWSYSQELLDRVEDGGWQGAGPAGGGDIPGERCLHLQALIWRHTTGDARINPNPGHAPRKLSEELELVLVAHFRSRHARGMLAQVQAWLLAEYGVDSAAVESGMQPDGSACRLNSAVSHRAGSAGRGGTPQTAS